VPREVVYRGRRIAVAVDSTVLPDGTAVRRDVVLHPGAVVILPLVDDGRVCLLRNHRPAVGETLWELPAGTLEPGEAPDRAAIRELAEETGYAAARWRKLAEFYPSPGVLSETMHLYVAAGLTPGPMRPEKDEDLEPHVIPWEQAVGWVLDGTVRDAKTIAGVLLWDRLRGQTGAEAVW
jgi:ADP-ribose pyrophosphatase